MCNNGARESLATITCGVYLTSNLLVTYKVVQFRQ